MSALETQIGGNHYKGMRIQPIEFIQANDIPFSEGCVIKYIARWKAKNGLQDLEKAKHYIELLIDHEKRRIADASATASGIRALRQQEARQVGNRMRDQAKVFPGDAQGVLYGGNGALARCTCQSPADCSGQCYQGSMPL